MALLLLGVSHKTAPAVIRERVSLSGDEAVRMMERLKADGVLDEVAVLSTCNRTEVYGYVQRDHSSTSLNAVRSALSRHARMSAEELDSYCYACEGASVVRHLFTVVSSLDSMVLGEQQILGQVRSAYRLAASRGFTSTVLNRLFHQTMRLGKEVRSKTDLGKQHLSVAAVALDQAKALFGKLAGRSVLVVGAGEMAQLSLRYLVDEGVTDIAVANRTLSHAQNLVEGIECRAVELSDVPAELVCSDIVICSTSSPDYVITRGMVEGICEARGERPLLLLDIAIPRDVDPACGDLPFVRVLGMDDLSRISEENRKIRIEAADDALGLISESMDEFAAWVREGEVIPAIKALRFFADDVVEGELSKLSKHLHDIDDKELQSIRAAMNAVANKLLHRPFKSIHSDAGAYESLQMARSMMALFDLQAVETGFGVDSIELSLESDLDRNTKGE